MRTTCRTSRTSRTCRRRMTATRTARRPRPPDPPTRLGARIAARALRFLRRALMTNKILIGIAAIVAAGFAALFGGVFANEAGPAPDALAASQSAEDFKAGF